MIVKDLLAFLKQNQIKFTFVGNSETSICGFSSLSNYKSGSVTWIGRKNSIPDEIKEEYISLAVVQEGVDVSVCNAIITKESKRTFFEIVEFINGNNGTYEENGKGNIIGNEVVLGEGVIIGSNCTIVGTIEIEKGTIIHDNVTIVGSVKIGENCVIQSGVRIGEDGFGYFEDYNGENRMIKHYGRVVIGNNVFVGANTAIARGTIDDTIIGDGTKIDTLCHIAHNVMLGKRNSLITGTKIYGSVKTGDNCYFATSIVKDHVVVGDNVIVGMGSVVLDDVPGNSTVIGCPARRLR